MPILAGFPTRARLTVRFDKLMYELLQMDGLLTLPAVDVDSLDSLPLLTVAGGNGHMIRNGFPGAGWEWTLFLTLYAPNRNDGDDMADTIYQIVHGWEDDQTLIAGLGYVNGVEDVSMFDRIGGAKFANKQIVQYAAAFTVRVRPA